MRHVGCAVKQGVDAVTAVSLDRAATSVLCMLLNDGAILSEQSAGLCDLDGLVETLASSLNDTDRLGVSQSLVTNIVRLVDVSVEAVVVKGHINVDDIAIFQDTLIGDTVTDALVHRCAYRLGEMAVVERGGI